MRVSMPKSLFFLLTSLFFTLTAQGAQASPHELGWFCIQVNDVRVAQVSMFNREAPMLTVWVPKSRFLIEKEAGSDAGRLCVPTIVALGSDDIPRETLIFEKTPEAQRSTAQSKAEFSLTPESMNLTDLSLSISESTGRWMKNGDSWTFQVPNKHQFEKRSQLTFPAVTSGEKPADAFKGFPTLQKPEEFCRPIMLEDEALATPGRLDLGSQKVRYSGTESLMLKKGSAVTLCEGLSSHADLVAVASPGERGNDWYLIDKKSPQRAYYKDESSEFPVRYTLDAPFGDYNYCQSPSWRSATQVDLSARDLWHYDGRKNWRSLPDPEFKINRGEDITILDVKGPWIAFKAPNIGEEIYAGKREAFFLPTGPGQEVMISQGGFCPTKNGEWRRLRSLSKAWKVSQDTQGLHQEGAWNEIPGSTQVLMLCQNHRNPKICDPIPVGKAGPSPGNRMVLVQYASRLLALPESALREQSSAGFQLNVERARFDAAYGDILKNPSETNWVFGLGPGGRVSYISSLNHAWTVNTRVQEMTYEGYGFEGGLAVAGDRISPYLSFSAGATKFLHRFPDAPLEIWASLLAAVDVRLSHYSGMNFNIIGKAQLRWVNEFVPVNLEIGLNIGYGSTFGPEGKERFLLGLPIQLIAELVKF